MSKLIRPTETWDELRSSLKLRDFGIFDLEDDDEDENVFLGRERIVPDPENIVDLSDDEEKEDGQQEDEEESKRVPRPSWVLVAVSLI